MSENVIFSGFSLYSKKREGFRNIIEEVRSKMDSYF